MPTATDSASHGTRTVRTAPALTTLGSLILQRGEVHVLEGHASVVKRLADDGGAKVRTLKGLEVLDVVNRGDAARGGDLARRGDVADRGHLGEVGTAQHAVRRRVGVDDRLDAELGDRGGEVRRLRPSRLDPALGLDKAVSGVDADSDPVAVELERLGQERRIIERGGSDRS